MDARTAVRVAELGEAEFMYQMFATADGPSRTVLGMAQARIAGGEITVMAQDPTGGYWSRAIGLGIDEPLTGDVLDRSISFARDKRRDERCLPDRPRGGRRLGAAAPPAGRHAERDLGQVCGAVDADALGRH
jgi:hypothetical protein